VRVISQRILEQFWQSHPDAEHSLKQWFKTVLAANWQNLPEVRRVYPHAEGVETSASGVLTVFNICGNKHRLIARIRYDWQLINVRCVLTHAEYDKMQWRK